MLNKSELKTLQDIESKYYMQPMIEAIKADLDAQIHSTEECLNFLIAPLSAKIYKRANLSSH